MTMQSYTAIVERDGDLFVAHCPELDIASQGTSVEEATANLKEAVELFLECADPCEIENRLRGHGFAQVRRRGSHIIMQQRTEETTVTVPVPDHPALARGTLLSIIRQSGLPRSEFE